MLEELTDIDNFYNMLIQFKEIKKLLFQHNLFIKLFESFALEKDIQNYHFS